MNEADTKMYAYFESLSIEIRQDHLTYADGDKEKAAWIAWTTETEEGFEYSMSIFDKFSKIFS